MKAMILAAGRGERLRPLTDTTPKPLLYIGQERLLERAIRMLSRHGFYDIVINVAYLSSTIINTIGDGTKQGVHIHWSDEKDAKLNTGGGILHALPKLDNDMFLVINSDLYTDWTPTPISLPAKTWAHLVMVENPPHHSKGDFFLTSDGQISNTSNTAEDKCLTFGGIAYYRPALFENYAEQTQQQQFALAAVLRDAIAQGKVRGEHYVGKWHDTGDTERLLKLRQSVDKLA